MIKNNLVYIVEDETELQHVLADIVEGWGYEVRCFSSGPAALEEIKHRAPHFLITDWNLPIGSGVELIRHLRSLHPEAAVLLMTGCEFGEKFNDLRRERDIKVIKKPFDISTILNFLKNAS